MGFSVELTTVSRFSQPNFPNVLQKVSLLFLLGSSLTLLEPQSRFGDKPKRDCGSKGVNENCFSMILRPFFVLFDLHLNSQKVNRPSGILMFDSN